MSIFAAPTSANGSLELKCGYCTFADKLTAEQKSLTITPQSDKKGFLSIAPPGQDGVVHLKWTNRETKAVEPDVLIFPNEWTFEPIKTGRDGELVWLLQLAKNKKRRHFFWSLESDKDIAKDKATKLASYLKDPSAIPAAGAAAAGGAGGAGPGGMSQQQLLQMLQGAGGPGGVDPAMLEQLMSGMGGGGGGGGASGSSQPPASSPSAAPTGGAVSGDAMRAALAGMSSGAANNGGAAGAGGDDDEDDDMEAAMLAAAIAASMAPQGDPSGSEKKDDDDANNNAAPVAPVAPQASATPTPAAPSPAVVDNNMAAILAAFAATPLGQQPQQQQQQFIQPLIAPLSDVVTEAEVAPLLADPEIVAALLPLLPEGQQTEEELRTTIRTPQFRSTLRTLSSALMSDNVNSIFANFGLNAVDGGDAMAQGNPILAFLQALQAQTDREESSSSKE